MNITAFMVGIVVEAETDADFLKFVNRFGIWFSEAIQDQTAVSVSDEGYDDDAAMVEVSQPRLTKVRRL
ncbi:hypothetical protein ACRYI5_10785 [Furfurilactobacillus sp. WILCCON 0119]